MMEYGNYGDLLGQPLWIDSKHYPLDIIQPPPPPPYTQLLPTVDGVGVYEVVNGGSGVYTPPQTPPYNHQQPHPSPYQRLATNADYDLLQHPQHQPMGGSGYAESDLVIPLELAVYATSMNGVSSGPEEVARELAVVDELVRTRANTFTAPAAGSPSPSSCSSSCSPSPNSSSSGESSSVEDGEWSPKKRCAEPRARKRARPHDDDDAVVVDKRTRKKEQNKNAATRYRIKKKAEVAEILTEEQELERVKCVHQAKISDLEREIGLIKGLMRDFFKKQGLIE